MQHIIIIEDDCVGSESILPKTCPLYVCWWFVISSTRSDGPLGCVWLFCIRVSTCVYAPVQYTINPSIKSDFFFTCPKTARSERIRQPTIEHASSFVSRVFVCVYVYASH